MRDSKVPTWLSLACWASSLGALAYGITRAIDQWWTCDDAYIHFRYSENFASGRGLVYNAGEYVEGYLTFLWNVLLALGISLGQDPLAFANAFGIGCFVLTILVLMHVARRLRTADGLYAPVAAVAFAVHGHTQVFATSGMETALVALLVTCMAVQLIAARKPWHYFMNGLLGVIVTLTRLDTALFSVGAFVVVLLASRRQRRWLPVVLFCLPTLLIYAPYFGWRWQYYGSLLPNLYYAKSAGDAYLSQGWFYTRIFLQCYYVMIPALLVLPIIALCRRRQPIEETGWTGLRAPAVLCLFVFPYLAYIVWVGGDFMFGRFFIPITPLILLGLQLVMPGVGNGIVGLIFLVLVVTGLVCRAFPERLESKHGYQGVTEEPFFYQTHARYMGTIGRALATHTRGTDTRVMIGAGQAALGYFGRFPVVIEKNGLTDAYIARLPLETRGRVAHERAHLVPERYFTHDRKVNFYFDTDPGERVSWTDPVGNSRWIDFKIVGAEDDPAYEKILGTKFEWIKGYMLIYKRELMDELRKRPGIVFEDFTAKLDQYLARLHQGAVDRDRVRRDFEEFAKFYFDHNKDEKRRMAFEAAMR